MVKTVGVLALQGAFRAHKKHIEELGHQYLEVKTGEGLAQCDALIIPGGESTSMLKLIAVHSLEEALQETLERVPCWGICAGAILMATKVEDLKQKCFGAIDVSISRNAYGRQIDSFSEKINGYEVAFIRAPIIKELITAKAEALAHTQGQPTWVVQGRHMITTFHPELNPELPSPMHKRFQENF